MPLNNYITLSQLTKSIKGLVNKINGEATVTNNKIGNLANLNTSAKTDLVAAINEVAASSGGSSTTQVNADWNATSGVAEILNKPIIPNVSDWALSSSKPTYTAAEVGALPSTYTAPVTSVNGQTGAVNLTIPEVTITTAGAVTQALDAEKIYHFTGALSSLTLTFNAVAVGQLAQYHFDFDSGSTAPTVTIPSVVTMQGGTFAPEANKHYEVDILNGYGVYVAW